MNVRITEIQITPVKPQNGLVAFASFILDKSWYMGSIGIVTRIDGGYRLVYPTKKVNDRNINLYHPINKEISNEIENAIISRFEDVMNHDRYRSTHATA
jgi:DNA-binding cell septation regulator SpoVG